MMRVLSADTTTAYCSVALCDFDSERGEVLAVQTVLANRRHSEILLSLAQGLLASVQLSLQDVTLLAVSVGPGSFTGLRVGVSAWKGLALGLGLPLVGVPTLDAMARRVGVLDGVVCPVLDARMSEVFSATYRFEDGERSQEELPSVGPPEALAARLPRGALLLGDGAVRYRGDMTDASTGLRFADPQFDHPCAAAVAFEAADLLAAGESADAGAVRPIYLRKSQAEEARASVEGAVVT